MNNNDTSAATDTKDGITDKVDESQDSYHEMMRASQDQLPSQTAEFEYEFEVNNYSKEMTSQIHQVPPPPHIRVDIQKRSSWFSEEEDAFEFEKPAKLARFTEPFSREQQQSNLYDGHHRDKSKSWQPDSTASTASAPNVSKETQCEAYRYSRLLPGQFRLIMLHPPANKDPDAVLQCQLVNCSLRAPDYPYTAVSYTWDDVGDSMEVLIGDVKMRILSSLHGALRALRHHSEAVFVWADAISIDQANFAERSEQVQLMAQIYRKAISMAIWLGPEGDDSDLAFHMIESLAEGDAIPSDIGEETEAPFSERHFAAVVALYDRDYWQRLWVVQEVFNAPLITVYCGQLNLPWEHFKAASEVFRENALLLERVFPPGHRSKYYQAQFLSGDQVLLHQGPQSLDVFGSLADLERRGDFPDEQLFQDLLHVIRACRRKLCFDPKDKVFGVQGLLCEEIRREITVDYKLSVKDVYVNVVDILLRKTACLDVICESIHFPTYINNNNNSLPSFVPDWSHVPSVAPISLMDDDFHAAGDTRAIASLVGKGRLRVSAIPLGRIQDSGIAVGTLCTLADYLMAFLHWRALLLDAIDRKQIQDGARAQQDFCLTLSLHSLLRKYKAPRDWMDVCYHAFASSIRERLPRLAIDADLAAYTELVHFGMNREQRRLFIQDYFGSKMMGRCFCITDEGEMGLGTGSMAPDDLVVVPLGCSTPVILRPEGSEYRFIGDVYVCGYMDGEAVREYQSGSPRRSLQEYLLH